MDKIDWKCKDCKTKLISYEIFILKNPPEPCGVKNSVLFEKKTLSTPNRFLI